MEPEAKKPSASPPVSSRLCGLTWAESGNPFFHCVVGEKREAREKSFTEEDPVIEIIDEGEAKTFSELKQSLHVLPGLQCSVIYTSIEPKYLTFIHSFMAWKREEKAKLLLKQTKSSSFEASLLRIKELIAEKKLVFPAESTIKSQLTIFSKS